MNIKFLLLYYLIIFWVGFFVEFDRHLIKGKKAPYQVLKDVVEAKILVFVKGKSFKNGFFWAEKVWLGIFYPQFEWDYYFVIPINVLFCGPLLIQVNFVKCLDLCSEN